LNYFFANSARAPEVQAFLQQIIIPNCQNYVVCFCELFLLATNYGVENIILIDVYQLQFIANDGHL